METVFDKPLDTELSGKQNATDNALTTTAKTVVGAINENASGITSNSSAIANLNTDVTSTTDILASALTVTGTKFFKGIGGADYTGNVPNGSYKYGVFQVFKRNAQIFVLAEASGSIAINRYENGAWDGWQEFARKSDSNWSNVTLTALQGSLSSYVCIKNNSMTYVTVELTGPITAYQTVINGFPKTYGTYYGELMNSDGSLRIRFYIAGDGQWFLRSNLSANDSVRTSFAIPLNE